MSAWRIADSADPGAHIKKVPVRVARSISVSASATVAASGFSLKQATPASRTSRLTAPWYGAGVRLNTASTVSLPSISPASR